MSKEKGTQAQVGTGSKLPTIQKCHTTGEGNVKVKMNRAFALGILSRSPFVLKQLRAKMVQKGV